MNKVKGMTLAMGMLAVVSCSTKQGTGSLIGAGGGALVGGIIGKLAGNTAVGAAIGGAVGAGAGAIIGHHMDKVAEQAKQIENAKVEKVTDSNGLEASSSPQIRPTSTPTQSRLSPTSLRHCARTTFSRLTFMAIPTLPATMASTFLSATSVLRALSHT